MTCTCSEAIRSASNHFVSALADKNLTVIPPGLAGSLGGRKNEKKPLNLGHGFDRELAGRGQKDRG